MEDKFTYIEKKEKTKERWKKWSVLVLIIVMSIPYVLIAKNVMIKTIPMAKESATGVIIDREINRNWKSELENDFIDRSAYNCLGCLL